MPVERAGDDEPAVVGHRPAKILGVFVSGRVARRAGRAEHRHLALRPIRCEHGERAAQFAERLAENFEVVVGGAFGGQLVGGLA